jgi:cell division protease FtsH
MKEAKQAVMEIVEFLKSPKKFENLGAEIPKGVLLIGPAGVGKTLLAKAIAGEAGVPFFSLSASEFVEMFVGVGASRVRDLFEKAKQSLPCIIFIDEIDAMGRHRGVGLGGGNDEREQTLNEFLVQLDGFTKNKGLIVFAATNRPDVLDSALTRSGRFDRQITVSLPDIRQRTEILGVHAKKVTMSKEVNLEVLARGTPGFSGADLENVVNEAALLAARKNKKGIESSDLEEAKDKILMGAEKKTLIMSEDERKLTAYHESGHAIVAFFAKHSDPIHKATITPRGRALGMVVQLPENDKVSMTKIQLIERIRILMAGRIAEEKIFGNDKRTTGASNDIKVATDIAKKMVLEYGMSEVCGMMNYQDSNEIHFGQVSPTNHHSQEFAKIIDSEIKKILDEAYAFSKNLIDDHIDDLNALAIQLLEKETLTGEEIKVILTKEIQ